MTAILTRLIGAHRALNHEIARELARRLPDSLRLTTLKKRRLAIKDRIHQILTHARRGPATAR